MSNQDSALLGGIEAGGTKFVLAVGPSPDRITARHAIPTRSPAETLAEAAAWFAAQQPIRALGIASFGPVELDTSCPNWGRITNTPKAGWAQCDIVGHFARKLGVPVGFDTDVNGAALAEHVLGAGKGRSSLAYVTVGTGIGGGLVSEGRVIHGAAHPEIGHVYPRRAPGDDHFAGLCPHHGDCLEGLASGLAIAARWGASLSQLPADHPAHGIVADYLGQLCHTVFATTASEIVVLGGGVMQTPGLIERVRQRCAELGAGYLPASARHQIVLPGLDQNSGICGALLLGANNLEQTAAP
ncbi:MAG TPA: ROK family protein [Novosphingobium sp.]|nr:ROK family protein [Novosphingobium sp.]